MITRALLTGATGLVGRALLARVPEAAVLTRDVVRARAALGPDVDLYAWDASASEPPPESLEGVSHVFHLAGESVAARRWSRAQKARIRDSRVLSTRHLVAAMAKRSHSPTLICASATGYYGDRGDETLTEDASPGDDFLARVCVDWEDEAEQASALGARVVRARFGLILASSGGALDKMLGPFRAGVGGRLGSGTQWMPWVHLDDVIGLLLHAANEDSLAGPLNVVSPEPVRNADFTRALGKVLGRPTVLPMPELALRALFGELRSILLASQRAMPERALSSGYRFTQPELAEALASCVLRARP